MIKIYRYSRNVGSLSHEENLALREFKVCIVGCGGLGGYIIETLGRIGVGSITVVDGDVFEISNLNRQTFSNESNIGKSKALAVKEAMQHINSDIEIKPITDYIDESNAEKILQGHHVIVDALDNIPTRLVLEKYCAKLEIPLVHGAIAGWYGQVSVVFPGECTLNKIYGSNKKGGIEEELGNLPFTASLVASIQSSQVIKILLDRGDVLRNKMLFIDILNNDYKTLELW